MAQEPDTAMRNTHLNDTYLRLLHAAIDLARSAREHGNHPFGALLADQDGRILIEVENTVTTGNDCTGCDSTQT
jgi:tRNA(Arg) A34 adenosine deaminase TadA